jgi:hypothetical protein
MPEPRYLERVRISRVTLEPNSRDQAAAKRRQRNGRLTGAHGGSSAQMPVEIRNGLPFRPYVYRGLGYDQYGDDDA